MNMIVCRHPMDNGKYLFRVPEDINIDVGTLLRVDTRRGEQPAQAITSSFTADPEVICPLWGTSPKKMMRVVSCLHESILEWPEKSEDVSSSDQDDD